MRMFENDSQQVRGNDWAARRSGGRAARPQTPAWLVARTAWLMLDDAAYGSSPGCPATSNDPDDVPLGHSIAPAGSNKSEDAREQLERVAIEIEPESDPGLQQLLDEVRAEIEQGT